MMLKQKCRMKKKHKTHKSKEKLEDENFSYHCPVVRSKLHFSGKTSNLQIESSQIKTLSSAQKEEDKNDELPYYFLDCGDNKASFGLISGESKAEFPNNSGVCSVWGVYKSYGNLETLWKKENPEKNKAIDEVLDSFDDKDHDLIFKKNMTQFRRKINSKTFYFDKNVHSSTEMLEGSKVNEKKNNVGYETEDFSSLKEKNPPPEQDLVKISTTGTLQKINFYNGCKLQKILASYSWLLSKGREFCKTMASRIETSIIVCPQPFREIDNLLESNIRTVIEKKLSKASDDHTTILHKRNVEAIRFENDLQEWLLNFKCAKNCIEIKLQGNEFRNDLMYEILKRRNNNQGQITDNSSAFKCPKYLSNSTNSFDTQENNSVANLEMPGVCKTQDLLSLKDSLNETSLVKTEDIYQQIDLPKRKALAFYEIPLRQIHKVVEIINNLSYGFIVQYHIQELISVTPFKSSIRNVSDTALLIKKDKTSASNLPSGVLTTRTSLPEGTLQNPQAQKIFNINNQEFKLPIEMKKKTKKECSFPMSVECENMINDPSSRESSKQEIIVKNQSSKEVNNEFKTKSLIDLKVDGFHILYDAMHKQSINWHDNDTNKTDSANSFIMDIPSKFLPREKKEMSRAYDDILITKKISLMHVTEVNKDEPDLNKPKQKPTRSLIQELSKTKISKTVDNENSSVMFKYKSDSSPKENIADHNLLEHRVRRSLNFVKDVEKFDLYSNKKKRICIEKGTDIRRTGSASLETHSCKLGKNKSLNISLQKKESVGAGVKFKSQLLPDELKALVGTEYKSCASKPNLNLSVTKILNKEKKVSLREISDKKYFNINNDNKKMFVLEKNGTNVRKEVVAAFNSIKDFTYCRKDVEGGSKRMSLVIMLSRNK